ncbi:MAG: biotin/lipoate--protein ligase family protein [Candidatus Puniceispirillum sp.]
MSIDYELDPADDTTPPQLPPLLTAVEVPTGQDVLAKAIAVAPTTEVGTVFYSQDVEHMRIAIRLAPEVPLQAAGQMLFAMMIGLGDSIGALAPPEVAVTYQLPGYVLLNKGRAAVVRLSVDPAAGSEDVPSWMIVSADVRIGQASGQDSTWYHQEGVEQTSLAEEGGGYISRTRLVESSARHFLVWVNRWSDDGFRPLYDSWMQRLDKNSPIAFADQAQGEWLGLDEHGGALIKLDGKPVVIPPHQLEAVCGSPVLRG